jgi:hypothetical protein
MVPLLRDMGRLLVELFKSTGRPFDAHERLERADRG